jgi:leucyl aminopeptidase
MRVEVRQAELTEVDADLVAVGLCEGDSLPGWLVAAPGAGDASGEAETLTVLYPDEVARVVVVGLGKLVDIDAERLRVVAALVAKEAARLKATSLAWLLPETGDDDAAAEGIVTGTILGAHRFDRFKGSGSDGPRPPALESLTLLGQELEAIEAAAETARIGAEAQNRARDLQSTPANVATPAFLAARAEEIAAAHEAITVEVLGREEIAAKKMGGLVAVSQGSEQDPRLIVLRYDGDHRLTLGLVGKGVTFDTGGISLKPGAGMEEMKYDMSGAAAVLEAVAAIAELGLGIDVIAVVPATENMPSGSAIKPGDVITQYDGTTVEINNTDAEGRLILADALAYAIELGADWVVDLATLTGAVVIALGSTYAGVIANDDVLAREVESAGNATGELTWRLPLHPEYTKLMKGTIADLSNLAAKREAGTATAGAFLAEFVGETSWAHVDIAGTAWDVGRAYTGKDASGYGVRLLIELARSLVDTSG